MIDTVVPRPAPAPQTPREPPRRATGAPAAFVDAVAEATPETPAELGGEGRLRLELLGHDGASMQIVLPWGLAANNGLSQQLGATDTAVFLRLQARFAPTAASFRSPDTEPLQASEAVQPLPTQSLSPFAPWCNGGIAREVPGEAARRMAPIAPLSESEPWQARWLKWLREKDGHWDVRVRDYRLDAAGTDELVAQLHAFASAHGLTLKQVTVNARVIWNHIEYNTGGPHGR